MRRTARPKGYVLIFVLLVLVMLTLLVAGAYGTSEEQVMVATTMMSQRVAAARADEAAQRAVALIKGGALVASTIDPCLNPATNLMPSPTGQCPTDDVVTSGLVSQPGDDPASGAGWNYQWYAYRSVNSGNPNLVTIRAEGYWGVDSNALNFASAVVEVEILVPKPVGGDLSVDFDYGQPSAQSQ